MNDTNNRVPVKLNGQDVNIQNREKIKVTGVNDIIGFDETFVDIETELGKMLIRGEGLKIARLSLEQHELVINGYVYSCEYEDTNKNKKGIVGRIFR
ncbi:MAG: sporulation protein YabP [Clostridiales bacterium]|jgi:sporulation protein yabP|uniref:Sporulation protein YabP n=1 Tax=Candidatus Egerieisoma faecipullorum TaxID=2840963 RepID=A0A9D1I8I9_9CLOT|nr:sporulation protein YabP [Clostridiales bacterium]PWM23551.1 MAG: sporulation protein YabP [Clostridiales bacterium]HBV52962.1 sporulation protein YabP [Clostridiales bacterium]HIU30253.1 sporulation protein YabP [Candidatus Egerieisoma faecipullorum]